MSVCLSIVPSFFLFLTLVFLRRHNHSSSFMISSPFCWEGSDHRQRLRCHHVVDGGGARGHVRPLQRVVDVATEHGQVLREPKVEEVENI